MGGGGGNILKGKGSKYRVSSSQRKIVTFSTLPRSLFDTVCNVYQKGYTTTTHVVCRDAQLHYYQGLCTLYLHVQSIEYWSDDVTKNFFCISAFWDTMSRWSMMKNNHSPNLVGIGSWGPEIWPHEYLYLAPLKSV